MSRRANKRGIRSVCTVMIFAAILCIIAPMSAYAANNPLTITVKQVFTNTSPTPNNTFNYRLVPAVATNPMPAGSTAAGFSFTISGSSSTNVGPITYTTPGKYEYELRQIVGTSEPGYTYDMHVFTLEVYVDTTLHVELIALNMDRTKTTEIEFRNAFGAVPTNPFLMVDPPVRKTVFGYPTTNSTFTFRLTASNPSNPMPTGSANGVKTLTIVGSGEQDFGTWSYTQAGVYYYTITEVNTGIAGYTYDTEVYTITDTVTLNSSGELVLSRVVTNRANAPVTSASFANMYNAINPLDGPKTGDGLNTDLYTFLYILGGIMAVAAAAYLLIGLMRKRTA